jgi:hypothetical protein
MPIKECSLEGKPGYKWGEEGHCYVYDPNSESSKRKAKKDAAAQGVAIIRSEGKSKKK